MCGKSFETGKGANSPYGEGAVFFYYQGKGEGRRIAMGIEVLWFMEGAFN
jgi:hypothetical protein